MSATLSEAPAHVLARLASPEQPAAGREKVTGTARFAADETVPRALWAAFLGSPLPHARVRAIDTRRAAAMPGVRAVVTGADARGLCSGRRLLDRPVLAWDTARFVGDRVAAVAADSPEIAAAAIAEIDLDLEELPAILDVGDALAPDAPELHPGSAGYRYLGGTRPAVPHPNVQGRLLRWQGAGRAAAELQAIFASAAHVFEHEFETPRQHPGYLEPRAMTVWIDADATVHVRTTNKTPYLLREQLAATFSLPVERIDVEGGFIGGDFGGKGYSIDEYVCVLLARATGRPIRSITSQADELAATNVRHAARVRLRTAVDDHGTLVAHQADLKFDGGAYAAAKPLPHLALAGGVNTLAAYRIPHVRIEALTVYTNTVPAGHVRAPGEVQALFAGESHLDAIARALSIDPLALRLRNVVRDGDVGAAGDRFREARAVEVLEAVRRELPWDRPRPRDHGVGVALGVRHVGTGAQELRLRLGADGRILVRTGLADQGAGAHTMIRRVLAAALSVDEARVTVQRTSTAGSAPDRGVGGSRVTHTAGRAAEQLGVVLREWIDERLPAALPDVPPEAVLRDDRLVHPVAGTTLATFDELAARLVAPDAPVELSTRYDSGDHGEDGPGDYGFAATAVEVAVDRETGAVRIVDALQVADIGTVINPVAHRGQIEGGFAMGVGAALIEGLAIEDGVITSLSLADARLPAATDVPPLRITLLPTPVGPGPFGAKMVGELTIAHVAPAVANAIADAVGVRLTRLPMTAERILAALDELGDRAGDAVPDASRRD